MGLLDRAISGVNRIARPVQRASTPVDPRLARGRRVEERGELASGTIVGIERRFRGDQTHTRYALAVPEVDGSVRRFGTEVTTTPHLHWLRLGLPVPVRITGDRGVLDWSALAASLGLADGDPGQRAHRSAPADGIDDTSVVSQALKLLRRGHRTTATVEAAQRCTVLGMLTVSWDLHLRLADSTATVVSSEEVPPYAWWLTAPGATLPVAIDPTDPDRVAVDWPELATTAARARPPSVADRPPPGSLAAEMRTQAPEPTTASHAGGEDTAAVIAANRNEAHVTGALRDFVGEVQAGRMKPKAFLKLLAEWESAGLCTTSEAAAARAAAGLDAS